jgi:cell wall-associated NlpC family hydrolase
MKSDLRFVAFCAIMRNMKKGLCICLLLCFFALPLFSTSQAADLGDLDGTGSIDSADAAIVLRYIVALQELDAHALSLADVDESGSVDTVDAAAILRYTVGLDTLPPSAPKVTRPPTPSPTPSPTPTPTPSPTPQYVSPNAQKILAAARKYAGTPYSKLDCADYVAAVFEDLGVKNLGWYANKQWQILNQSSHFQVFSGKNGIQPGDIVFWMDPWEEVACHVAIASTNGMMWDSTNKEGINCVSERLLDQEITTGKGEEEHPVFIVGYARYLGIL